ncbi:MAG TPA: type II toxin-antitoxin system prevent-host-death family antitoxin [Thermoanaerobaculia bacterium]|nr:type II toxin-antitoxin system prevent-host-death family antitoxin [Thermoanaerobaculia bacterium]
MKVLRAVDLRGSLSRVARSLERTGDPVALTMRGKVVGVLISVRDWNERFTGRAVSAERRRLVAEILADRVPASGPSVDAVVEEIRAR